MQLEIILIFYNETPSVTVLLLLSSMSNPLFANVLCVDYYFIGFMSFFRILSCSFVGFIFLPGFWSYLGSGFFVSSICIPFILTLFYKM